MTSIDCPHCGCQEIVTDICVESGQCIGLRFSPGFWDLSFGFEKVLADLCTSCGTVVRLHVQNPNRKWKKQTTKNNTSG